MDDNCWGKPSLLLQREGTDFLRPFLINLGSGLYRRFLGLNHLQGPESV